MAPSKSKSTHQERELPSTPQRVEGWGMSLVELLAPDVQAVLSKIAAFSPQNSWQMHAFYLAWTDEVSNLQQPVGDSSYFSDFQNNVVETCILAGICYL